MSLLKPAYDPLLTGVSSQIPAIGTIADLLLPSVQSATYTGSLAKYGNEHLRVESSLVGGKSGYRRAPAVSRTTSAYSIEGHGLEELVTQADYQNVLAPYDAEKDVVEGLTAKILLGKEVDLATVLTDNTVITQYTTLTGTNQFNDYLNSDPIAKFKTARSTVRTGCGMPANTAIMDWQVWNTLRFHPQMLDAMGFNQARPGGLTEAEMATALGVDRVLIPKAVYNSAKLGQSDSIAAVWGKDIIFCYVPTAASTYQVSLGYQVRLAGQAPRQVFKQSVVNPPGAVSIIVEDYYDMFISTAAAAYLIEDAIA